MLNRDESLQICKQVLARAKAAGAEDALVSTQGATESHARFADNRITTSGRSDDVEITATVWVAVSYTPGPVSVWKPSSSTPKALHPSMMECTSDEFSDVRSHE